MAMQASTTMRTKRRVSLSLLLATSAPAPQVEFDLHPDERIEIDDDDDVLRRELGI